MRRTSKRIIWITLTCLTIVVLGAVAFVMYPRGPKTLTLDFIATYDGAKFEFDQTTYANPGGDGVFGLRDFRFYVSNIVLSNGAKTYAVPDSYHLIRFDATASSHKLVIPDVPLRGLETVSFSLGLDADANGSIETRGDLDPNSRMAWNWGIGYKFLLAEGDLKVDDEIRPLVYHVGFNENRRDFDFRLEASHTRSADISLSISADIARLFRGQAPLDMTATPTIKMHPPDASMLADNYANLLQVSATR